MDDKETLREAVARAIAETEGFDPAMDCIEGWYETADAAIATMFERLRTPVTDALKFAYCQGARDVSYELTGDAEDDFGEAGDDYAAFAALELLTAFQQENSDV